MSLTISDLFEVDNEEYNTYVDKIKDCQSVYFFLYPNLVTINQLDYINEGFIEENMSYFKLAIIPVYKHYWKTSYLKVLSDNNSGVNYVYLNYEIDRGTFFNIHNKNYDIEYINKTSKEIYMLIDNSRYIFTYEAYSFMTLERNIILDDLTFYQILGIVYAACRFGFITSGRRSNQYSFKTEFSNPFDKNMKQFHRITLKSLEPITQIRFFDIWCKKKNCVVTGSTGVGKTSQVPKVFFWYNFLFGGFDILKKRLNLDFDFDGKDKTMLIFPRKALIVSNGENFLKSIGYRLDNNNMIIEGSPVTMNFKNVSNTIYYNKRSLISEFNICINRIAASIRLHDEKLSTVFVDEIHEHETFSDICITLLRNRCRKYNNIVLMSATIDEDKERIKTYFKNIEFIHIEGDKLFPVDSIYVGENFSVTDIVTKYKPDKGKAGIFFFPKISDIQQNHLLLEEAFSNSTDYVFIQMHSKIYPSPSDTIKKIETSFNKSVIVLSTNILESSLTLVNAQYVYDTGTFFSKRFYGGKVDYITKGMSEQRKGRVGRKFPGTYIMLYDISNLHETMKKINFDFLYPYIIFLKKFNIKFEDMFIIPDDFNRFEKTIEYLNQKNIVVNDIHSIKKIYKIYNDYPCNMIEYIYIYMNNKVNKELKEFEELDNDGKISFVFNNKKLLSYIKDIEVLCELVDIRRTDYGFLNNASLLFLNYNLDGEKFIRGQVLKGKITKNYYMISPNIFFPYC